MSVRLVNSRESPHGYWSSPASFVIVAAGAVIGLGNIWRLPYLAGSNGGGAFLAIYALALVFMALPVFIAGLIIGRRARSNPVTAIRVLASESYAHPAWEAIGWLAMIGAALVLSYYSVIAGWSMGYVFRAAGGLFQYSDSQTVARIFSSFVENPERVLGWHTIFMTMIVVIVAHGVRYGLERSARYLMLAAFFLLAVLWLFALARGDMQEAARYLFAWRPEQLDWGAVFEAFSQAFFTLGLGGGVMLAIGAYLQDDDSPSSTALTILVLNFAFSLVAGVAVFSLLFGAGLKPMHTVVLAFHGMPLALGAQTGGVMAGVIFYLLLLVVALSSAMLLLEPVVMWLMERAGMTRIFAATAAGMVIWFLGLGNLFSFNIWSGVTFFGKTYYQWLEWLTAHLILPLTALLICIFVARIMAEESVREGWGKRHVRAFPVWHKMLRFPARLGLILVLCYALGFIGVSMRLW